MASKNERLGGESSLAEGAAWLLVLMTWTLSFLSQVQLAAEASHRFPWPEPLIFAATTEVVAGACLLLARERARRGLPTGELMILAAVAWLVAIGAQVAVGWPDVVGILMHVWSPVATLWLWRVILRGRQPRPSTDKPPVIEHEASEQEPPAVDVEATPELPAEPPADDVPSRNSEADGGGAKRAKLRALLAKERAVLVADGRGTATKRAELVKRVAKRAGVTQRYARDIASDMERELRETAESNGHGDVPEAELVPAGRP